MAIAVDTKACRKCGLEKPTGEFWRMKSSRDGLQSACKPCQKASYKQWRLANPKRNAELTREWQERNREQHRAAARQWYHDNPGRAKVKHRRWYEKNKEHVRDAARRWREENPALVRAAHSRRKARVRGAMLDVVNLEAVLDRDGLVCYLCHTNVASAEIHFDHEVPLSRGGLHTTDNLRVTHARCNLRKGTRLVEELPWR